MEGILAAMILAAAIIVALIYHRTALMNSTPMEVGSR